MKHDCLALKFKFKQKWNTTIVVWVYSVFLVIFNVECWNHLLNIIIAFNASYQSSSNIGEFSKDVRLLAALEDTESDGDKLLDAARKLAGAFSDLLNAAQPGSNEVSAIVEINFEMHYSMFWFNRDTVRCGRMMSEIWVDAENKDEQGQSVDCGSVGIMMGCGNLWVVDAISGFTIHRAIRMIILILIQFSRFSSFFGIFLLTSELTDSYPSS